MTVWPVPGRGYSRRLWMDDQTRKGLIVLGALTVALVVLCLTGGLVARMLGVAL